MAGLSGKAPKCDQTPAEEVNPLLKGLAAGLRMTREDFEKWGLQIK
jgi:hypothetical protein